MRQNRQPGFELRVAARANVSANVSAGAGAGAPTAAVFDPDAAAAPIVVLSEHYRQGEGPWHAHRRAQLIHASEGVLTVRTADGLWVVPPQRGVWVLPGVAHQVNSSSGFQLRALYAEPRTVSLPPRCCVVGISRLVGELLIAASDFGGNYPVSGPEARLMRVVVDRLPRLELGSLHLPVPRDARMRRIAALLNHDPADPRSIEALAAAVGCSGRTAARLFVAETGLTFAQWRLQLRLLAALDRLGRGQSVTATALDVGYGDTSSFIAVFRRAFGATPARYFAEGAAVIRR